MQILWLLAMLPAVIASLLKSGDSVLSVFALCIAFSVTIDAIFSKFFPSKDESANWNPVTFAVLLALLMPHNATWWMILTGCFIMIGGKRLFGGLGGYPVHPVLLAFAMMQVSWPARFDYTSSLIGTDWGVKMIEPMRLVKTLGTGAESLFSYRDLFLGNQVAGTGNAMVVWLLAGGIFLIMTRQITWHIPVSFLAGVLINSALLHGLNPAQFAAPLFQILSGSAIFAAFFLATESTTSPVNPIPMLLYGLLGGLLLVLIRAFSIFHDGVAFTILLMNLCNPLLDKITPAVIGLEVEKHA
ncbi:MAG: RnfABCDGE type electron transport complex subunit D [Calditrichaceae bacterium]